MLKKFANKLLGYISPKDYYIQIKVPNEQGNVAKVLQMKHTPAQTPVRKMVNYLNLENTERPDFTFQGSSKYIPHSERTSEQHNLFIAYVCKALALFFDASPQDFEYCDVDYLVSLYGRIVEDIGEVHTIAKNAPIGTIQLLGVSWEVPNLDLKNRLAGATVHQMMQISTLKASTLDPDTKACPFETTLKTIAVALVRKTFGGQVDRVVQLEGARYKALEKAPYLAYMQLCFFLSNRLQDLSSISTALQLLEATGQMIAEMYKTQAPTPTKAF